MGKVSSSLVKCWPKSLVRHALENETFSLTELQLRAPIRSGFAAARFSQNIPFGDLREVCQAIASLGQPHTLKAVEARLLQASQVFQASSPNQLTFDGKSLSYICNDSPCRLQTKTNACKLEF